MADPVNNGQLPAGIATLCTEGAHVIGSGEGNLNLGAIITPSYVAAIPTDSSGGTAENTGYTVRVADATAKRITVSAPSTELATTTISVTR